MLELQLLRALCLRHVICLPEGKQTEGETEKGDRLEEETKHKLLVKCCYGLVTITI